MLNEDHYKIISKISTKMDKSVEKRIQYHVILQRYN